MDENKETENRKNSSYPYSEEPEKGPEQKPNGFANFSMTCGVMALLSLCCMMFPFSLIMGAGTFCFAILSRKDDEKFSRPAVAGMIMGGAAIVMALLQFFYILFILQMVDDPQYMGLFNEMYDEMIKIQESILP